MASQYTPEIKAFIAANCSGRFVEDLVVLINKEFGTNFRYGQIRAYLKNHKLRTNMTCDKRPRDSFKCKYSQEVVDWVRQNAWGVSTKDLAVMINEKFGIECTLAQVTSLRKRFNAPSGINTRYQPGHVPATKGTKGVYNVGGNRTSFKKGHSSTRKRPVGSERISKDGYIEIKIDNSRRWALKHRVVYEEAYGPIPEDHVITFKDGNPLNVSLDNLVLITKRENLFINGNGLLKRNSDPDFNMAAINTGKLISKIYERKNGNDRSKEKTR